MWRVTPCSRRSCTRSVVASTSWLASSRISTFHTSGRWAPSSNGVPGEDGRGNGPAAVAGAAGGGLLRLSSVRSACVCACSREGRVIAGEMDREAKCAMAASERWTVEVALVT